jgi:hypothetical protein
MARLTLAVTLMALSLGHQASADTDIRESETVTLKLPTIFLSQGRSALLEAKPTYIVDLVEEVGRICPRGAPEWRTAGFPDLGRYRDGSYLVVLMGRITPRAPVFLANPVARAAIVMNDQLLAVAKRFWKPLGKGAGFDGLKIEADLPRARTAEREAEGTDLVEWYAPWPELSRFAVDEITSAALLEGSVVLLDHNRVALPLDVAR